MYGMLASNMHKLQSAPNSLTRVVLPFVFININCVLIICRQPRDVQRADKLVGGRPVTCQSKHRHHPRWQQEGP